MPYLQGSNAILPNQYCGEQDCNVGPFSDKNVADTFVGHLRSRNLIPNQEVSVFAKGTDWIVQFSTAS